MPFILFKDVISYFHLRYLKKMMVFTPTAKVLLMLSADQTITITYVPP